MPELPVTSQYLTGRQSQNTKYDVRVGVLLLVMQWSVCWNHIYLPLCVLSYQEYWQYLHPQYPARSSTSEDSQQLTAVQHAHYSGFDVVHTSVRYALNTCWERPSTLKCASSKILGTPEYLEVPQTQNTGHILL